MCKCKCREVWRTRIWYTQEVWRKDCEISLLNIIIPHYWCFTVLNFIFMYSFFYQTQFLFNMKIMLTKHNWLKFLIICHHSTTSSKWNAFSCLFQQKIQRFLKQNIKLFWLMQMLSKSPDGRAMEWVNDITQPPSKTNFPLKRQSAKAKDKPLRMDLQCQHLIEKYSLPDINGLFLPFIW